MAREMWLPCSSDGSLVAGVFPGAVQECYIGRVRSRTSIPSPVLESRDTDGGWCPTQIRQADPFAATDTSRGSSVRSAATEPSVRTSAALSQRPPGAATPAAAGQYARRGVIHRSWWVYRSSPGPDPPPSNRQPAVERTSKWVSTQGWALTPRRANTVAAMSPTVSMHIGKCRRRRLSRSSRAGCTRPSMSATLSLSTS
jgi:hypothetical protein